jgi:transposase
MGDMIPSTLTLQHERVDDIPLLLGLMQQLNLPEVLELALGSHHLHQGISNGWLACGWMAYILSQADHRKVTVQNWAQSHHHTLQTLIGQPLRPIEFSDDRLSILLRRFADADWAALEGRLWQATCSVYEIPIQSVRLDATTTCGYHTTDPDGIMQLGHSKDHRPDLPQLKLMAAGAQPTGHLIASEVHPGNEADDGLYLPLIDRVRGIVGRQGLLYVGDCKMAALATRADIVSHHDFYLMPLPHTGVVAELFPQWVDAVVNGTQTVDLIYGSNEKGETQLFVAGYEFLRSCRAEVSGVMIEWKERVQLVKSLSLARRQGQQLEERLRQAEVELRNLTPAPGRGRRQYRDEATLQAAISAILDRFGVTDCLTITWEREERYQKRYEGAGRGGPGRAWHWEVVVRYQITDVCRLEEVIAQTKYRYGWRVQVTNLPGKLQLLATCVMIYNGGWSLEREFHLLKDVPLGIRPLYVREDEQLIGLTRLLTIALRLLTLFEIRVRAALEAEGEELAGLYDGQPNRKTSRPTATRLLRALARMEITWTQVECAETFQWQLSVLPPLLIRILELVDLSPTVYTQLADNSG